MIKAAGHREVAVDTDRKVRRLVADAAVPCLEPMLEHLAIESCVCLSGGARSKVTTSSVKNRETPAASLSAMARVQSLIVERITASSRVVFIDGLRIDLGRLLAKAVQQERDTDIGVPILCPLSYDRSLSRILSEDLRGY